MATLGLSKVFILDKYFTELQKFWDTEKKLQGKLELIDSILIGNIFSLCFLRRKKTTKHYNVAGVTRTVSIYIIS